MRLEEIRIQYFRSIEDQTIRLDAYTCLVGPNGSGKSTVLQALNVFFRNTTSSPLNVITLSEEDFHNKDTNSPVRITLTFGALTQEAKNDFKAYYRSGKLVISAVAKWDAGSGNAEVRQYGSRLIMVEFSRYFEADANKAIAADLKSIYNDIQKSFPELPKVATKSDMEAALRSFEETHPEMCKLLESDNQFYGWSKGDNRLRKYLQWIYIPAIKDPATEQDEGRATALGQLLERTVRAKVSFADRINVMRNDLAVKYEEMIKSEQAVLETIGASLTERIREWTHSGTEILVGWYYDPDKSVAVNEPRARIAVGENKFVGEIARLGHGLQRTVFVSLLQELAEQGETDIPTLLLGFEEPELYQHPPQARHMSNILEDLSRSNTQIILTTHSPYFISARGFENIRMFRKHAGDNKCVIAAASLEEISKAIGDALGEEPRGVSSMMATIEQIMQPSQNELYFTNIVVLVEGLEDIAFISTYMHLIKKWKEYRRYGCHFVVTAGKGSLSRPLAIANQLGIPAFVVFDSDAVKYRDNPGNNPRDNRCILKLCGISDADPMPKGTLWAENIIMWHSDITDVVRSDIGVEIWDAAQLKAKQSHGFVDGVTGKNTLLIAATLEELFDNGARSAVLDKLCRSLLAFASTH